VVVVDKENKAEIRGVEVGPWYGNDWFITRGLAAGETVVVDGMIKLSPGAPVKIVKTVEGTAKPEAAAAEKVSGGAGPPVLGAASVAGTAAPGVTPLPAMIHFDVGSARLSSEASATLANVALYLTERPEVVVDITGYTDKTGSHAKNVVLAKERAKAVRKALFDKGAKESQVSMRPPANITGGGDNQEARRVEVSPASAARAFESAGAAPAGGTGPKQN
jgi:membrane fusion protein (multidrug efflux system)